MLNCYMACYTGQFLAQLLLQQNCKKKEIIILPSVKQAHTLCVFLVAAVFLGPASVLTVWSPGCGHVSEDIKGH